MAGIFKSFSRGRCARALERGRSARYLPGLTEEGETMKGDPEIIAALNEVLTAELTAINQYYIHAKMCENWGYKRLYAWKRKESIEEMKDADKLIERILFLEGVPNMQRMNPVRVGEDAVEQNELDLALEKDAVARLNKFIPLCRQKGDAGTAELLEDILEGEEHSVDELEAHLHVIQEIGKANYLAQQLHDS
jgi:bacterioferritin